MPKPSLGGDAHDKAEVALRESAELLQAVLNAAVDGVVLIDIQGTIQMVNPAVRKLFGYAEAELLGRNVKMLMPQPWKDEHDGYLSRYRETGEKRIIGIGRQVEGRRRDGSTFPLDLAVSEVRHGQTLYYLGTLRDITERVRLEGEIRQAQKMEAIGRLAGGVAHDFNTLLGTIRGYSEMMLAELPPGEPLSRHTEQIHRAALRGADLTRQLLAFSRRQEIRSQPVDVGSLLADVETMLDRLIGEDIRVVRRIEPDLGRIQGDPGELHQIVLNLVVNARDAMPSGGTLTLSASNVVVAKEIAVEGGRLPAGGYVLLAVEDSGTGMPEEILRRIFEPFFTTKEPGKGTGLGLSTVHAIVRRSKGGIAVESRPGAGTLFRVYLPHSTESGPEEGGRSPAPEEPEPPPGAGATLLVVEDDAMFRGLLTQMLLGNGYRVLAAGNPAQALEIAAGQGGNIDLLLSDMVMPGGTGSGLAARLRGEIDSLKVILMSGYTDEALSSRDLDRTHADAFLEKPFATHELLRQIRLLLAG